MAEYAIMRCKKLAGMGSVAAALQHCYRERETLNADAARTPENAHRAAKTTDEAMGRLRALLPEKRRKDAVLAVEYVMTASPDWWKQASPEQQRAFFDRAQGWLADKYGADRIITATIHQDEATPHLSAFVVPLTQDRRLSAKEFIGSKSQMSKDQTTFAKVVQSLGLVRGIEGSKAKHQAIRDWYSQVNQEIREVTISPEAVQPKVLKKGFLSSMVESPEMIAERLTRAMQAAYAPTVEKARTSASERRRAEEMVRTVKERDQAIQGLQHRLEALETAMAPFVELAKVAKDQFQELAKEAAAKVAEMRSQRRGIRR